MFDREDVAILKGANKNKNLEPLILKKRKVMARSLKYEYCLFCAVLFLI